MSSINEIPLIPNPQRLQVTLLNKQYILQVTWNVPQGCWVLDIADVNNVPVLQGVPLVTGEDLLTQFRYLGIGGRLIVQTDHNPDVVPTFKSLGTTGHLYFLTP